MKSSFGCHSSRFVLPAVGALLATAVALAQPEGLFSPGGPGGSPGGAGGRPPIGLRIDYGFTGDGAVTYRGVKRTDGDASTITATVSGAVPLGDGWIMPLGLTSQTIRLGEIAGAPVPESIRTLNFGTGLSRRLNADWSLMGRIGATLYRMGDASFSNVGVSGGFNAAWRQDPKLTWLFGVTVNPDSDLPVLPFVGFKWAINDALNLALVFPEPRLTYRPGEKWSLHAGASLGGAVFRTEGDFGTKRGDLRYNHALGSYRDVRVGVGVGYKFSAKTGVEAGAGYSVDRQIAYERIGEKVEFDSAPYVRVGLKFSF